MPRSMTKYRAIGLPKAAEHSFIEVRGDKKARAYAKYGVLATYANITQADKKVIELRILGFDCSRTASWPFLIILN